MRLQYAWDVDTSVCTLDMYVLNRCVRVRTCVHPIYRSYVLNEYVIDEHMKADVTDVRKR